MLAPYVSGGQLTDPARSQAGRGRRRRRPRARRHRCATSRRPRRTVRGAVLPRRDRARRPAAADRRPSSSPAPSRGSETGEPHAPEAAQPAEHAGLHRLLRHGLPGRRGPHHRQAGGVRLLARLRPADDAALAGQAAELVDERSDHAQDAQRVPSIPTAGGKPARAQPVVSTAASPTRSNFAPGTYRSDISLVNWPQNDYWLGNLHRRERRSEAARHLARGEGSSACRCSTGCRPRRRAPTAARAGTACGCAPDISRHRATAWPSTPTSAKSRRIQGRVHRARAARRHRRAHERPADARGGRRARSRTPSAWQLPHRPAPQHRRRQLHRRQLAALPDSARRAASRSASRTCSRPARTSASRTSRTAATGCTRWSGTSAKRPGRSPPTRRRRASHRARSGMIRSGSPRSSRRCAARASSWSGRRCGPCDDGLAAGTARPRTDRRSRVPSSRRPCRRGVPGWRCGSSPSRPTRRASASPPPRTG